MKHPIQILLADDDEDDKMIFIEALEKIEMKFVINTVNDGVELIEYLNKDLNTLPHMLFLDLNMPKKDGHQALKEIRNNVRMKNLFIVVYSTSDKISEIEQSIEEGADRYIFKPSTFTSLVTILQDLLDSVIESNKSFRY